MDGHDRHVGGLRVLLDFDPDVVGVASQPFWLFFEVRNGKRRSHAPDYFARLTDSSALVLDVRPADRIKPKDQVAFDATRQACALLGWRYEVVDAPESTLLANLRWLASYRHPRRDLVEVFTALRAVFTHPTGLLDGAERVGEPIAVLPVCCFTCSGARSCTSSCPCRCTPTRS